MSPASSTSSTRFPGRQARQAGRQRGMTLIELLIAVAVIAILGAIATASYRQQVIKSRRAAGAACLQEAVQYMERYYTEHLTYSKADAPPAVPPCDSEVAEHYAVGLAASGAKTFSLQAVPQGSQSEDSCGTLAIDQAGSRSPADADCW